MDTNEYTNQNSTEEVYITRPIFREKVSLKLEALGIHAPTCLISESDYILKSIEEIKDNRMMDYNQILQDVDFATNFLKQNILNLRREGFIKKYTNIIFPYSTKMLTMHEDFDKRGLVVYIPEDCKINLIPSKLTLVRQLYSYSYTRLIVLNNLDLLPMLIDNFHQDNVISSIWLLLPEDIADTTLFEVFNNNTVFKLLFRNRKVPESLLLKIYSNCIKEIEEADRIYKLDKRCLVAVQNNKSAKEAKDGVLALIDLYVSRVSGKPNTHRIGETLEWINKITSNEELKQSITDLLTSKSYLFTENRCYPSNNFEYREVREYIQKHKLNYTIKGLEDLRDRCKLDHLIILVGLEEMCSKHYINGISLKEQY